MKYEDLVLKIPKETDDYCECSEFITESIDLIMENAMDNERNKIIINTNLKLGIQ